MIDLERLDSAVADRLRGLDDEMWGDMYLELLDYARYRASRLSFIKGGGELPLGRTPKDVVQEAIQRLFDGRRQWDPDEEPNLCDYLKSVISSIVSGLLEKAPYKHQDGTPLADHNLPSGKDASYNDCLKALQDILEEASSDDTNLENVRLGIEDNMKASEIAEVFSIDVERVYILARKLRRRTSKKMKQHPCNEHWTRLGF